MKIETDAQGQAMLSYYKDGPVFHVVERDDGFINVAEERLNFLTYTEWGAYEKKAIKYAHGQCLDVGCGAGRVLLYLQSKRLLVKGIDYSPLAVKVCKLRGAKDVERAEFKEFLVKSRRHKQKYDTILLFGNNFGIFGSLTKAKLLLRLLHERTSSSGTIIAESRDPYRTYNPVHLAYCRENKRRGKLPGLQHIRIRFMQYTTSWYDYLYVSKSELRTLLLGTGWSIKRYIDSDEYKKSGRYIAIIKKSNLTA